MLNWLFKTSPSPKLPRTAIGLMSGTSLDGLDACLVRETLDGSRIEVIQTLETSFPTEVERGFKRIIETGQANLSDLLRLESDYTDTVIQQCQQLIQASHDPVSVIGFHGQTLWHEPDIGSTLQIGFAERLAEKTGVTVAHQFRRGDMARGGQGAPLAPLFHEAHFLRDTENVAVLNLGGIANISLLMPGRPTMGWDIGPANTLADGWHQIHRQQPFDRGGAFAASGSINQELLGRLLSDPYFAKEPPKSTGREYFTQAWLDNALQKLPPIDPADVQATLNQLTAEQVHKALPEDIHILVVCGGGVHNAHLMDMIDDTVEPLVVTSDTFAIDPDYVEAACFAWLGLQCLDNKQLKTEKITGSITSGVLGSIVNPTIG
jgi:anhydro-N-acetylmuramic acid kinase